MSDVSEPRQPDDRRGPEDAWVADGLRVGASLDAAHVVLVLGDDPRRTALAALGVARAQAKRRRVALGDLLGDAEPIQQLLNGDDPEGLADSFVFGVSLNKIARPVPQFGELYVLPSGSEVPAYEDIFTSARWNRLAAGFRETGALLVVAAPADAAHVGDVVRLADGAVLVGEARLADMNGDKLLGRVRASAPNDEQQALTVEESSGAPPSRRWWQRLPIPPAAAAVGIALAVFLGAIGIWLAARPLVRGHEPSTITRRRNLDAAAGAVPSTLDSLRSDSTGSAAPSLAPVNPADSAASAGYVVLIARFNTQLGVTMWLQKNQHDLPAATFSPTLVRGERWYRALAGSYANRADADSLLANLRRQGQVGPEFGEVLRAPLSFLVDSVSVDAVPGMLKYFADRGQPVYALRQADGTARLYAGAFESSQDASLLVDAIRTSGIRPVLVYRTGRVYQ
jgi:hypothetical protein